MSEGKGNGKATESDNQRIATRAAAAEQKAKWDDLRARRGMFAVSEWLLSGGSDALLRLFESVFVVRCEYLYAKGSFLYEALSPRFSPVAESLESTEYMIVAYIRDGGIERLEFEPCPPGGLALWGQRTVVL